MEKTIYLRLRYRITVEPETTVYLAQIASIIAPVEIKRVIQALPIYKIKKADKNTVVLDAISIIEKISTLYPGYDIQIVGPNHTIINVLIEKRKMPYVFFLLVWLLLFIGSGISIMKVNEDVRMQVVQQKLFYSLTGIWEEKPLLFQIPYSLGLGIGMILFFNHIFKRKINQKPSPKKLEMFQYQQSIGQYLLIKENQESSFSKNDDV